VNWAGVLGYACIVAGNLLYASGAGHWQYGIAIPTIIVGTILFAAWWRR
jgi:hypothetical protein